MSPRKPRGRRIDAVLPLDKPTGMTSNAALQTVKRLFGAAKAGHTGSLDPLASGMLPICFGEATKLSRFLLEADKHYRVSGRLGIKTTSGDAEGEVVESRPVGTIEATELARALRPFIGAIEQVPSMFSAIKHHGQPLYKLAREGIVVEREPRTVHIHELEIVRFEGDLLELDLRCSKGTYVRTLVEDIGAALGCGAHVIALRRLGAGPYVEGQMVPLDSLRALAEAHPERLDAHLLPLESMVAHWPAVGLPEVAAFYLRAGQPVVVPNAPTEGWVRLYLPGGAFLGAGEILDDGKVAPRRLLKTMPGR